MNLENNEEELKAIKKLEAAFKACAKLGIKFTVMDGDLMCANQRLYGQCEIIEKQKMKHKDGAYPPIAYYQDVDANLSVEVKTYGSMDSCGGW